jgi:UDPglucose 6-dehydrogenase
MGLPKAGRTVNCERSKTMKIGIIGFGHVGTAMKGLFKDAVVYDGPKGLGSKKDINACDAAFVCVPTPMGKDGECDTTIVDEVLGWCTCNVLILRSTVRVGYTREMATKLKKSIVFQPEYYGETTAHPFADLSDRKWLSFGGTPKAVSLAIDVYKTVTNAEVEIHQAPSDEVEMAKYMENAFLATKVTFVNEMYDVCEKLGLDYNQVREIWIADPRIGRSHTFIYKENRGYGGSCLPKDISALHTLEKKHGVDDTLINAVIEKNEKYR